MIYENVFKTADKETVAIAEDESLVKAASPQEFLVQLVAVYDAQERVKQLQAARKLWPEEPMLRELDAFFALRYTAVKTNVNYADKLLALVLEPLSMLGIMKEKSFAKSIYKLMDKSPLLAWAEDLQDELLPLRRELFFGECMHVLGLYADICRHDKRFASSFMGLVKAGPEKVEEQINSKMTALASGLGNASNFPKYADKWTDSMKIFAKAAKIFAGSL